jgi:imidazolonepropionase-like amidohydrolase
MMVAGARSGSSPARPVAWPQARSSAARTASAALLTLLLALPALSQEPESRPESRPDSRASTRAELIVPPGVEGGPASRPRRGGGRRTRPESGPDSRSETRPESRGAESKPAESPFLAIVNGTVYPVSGPVIRQGTVLIKNDKIVEVGRQVQVPAEARVIDARNKHVAPGFVAVRAVGTFGTGASARGEEKQSDQANPFNQAMLMALSSGITTVCEGGTQTAQGQIGGFIGKHTYGTLEGMSIREPAAMFLQYSGGDMSSRYQTRETLQKAVEHRQKMRAYFTDVAAGKQGVKAPTADEAVKNFVRVMEGELPCIVQGSSALELEGLAELSLDFDLPLVILDAREGWTMTGRLARAKISVVLTPRQRGEGGNEPTRFYEDASGWSIESGAKLEAAGVPWCVRSLSPFVSTGGIAGRDLMQINMDAAFTVRGGASEDAALRSVTLAAAEILKVSDRVGSLAAGRDADVVIFDLEPLDYRSFAEIVLVNGKTVYEKDKCSFFNHIQTDRSKGLKGRWWDER